MRFMSLISRLACSSVGRFDDPSERSVQRTAVGLRSREGEEASDRVMVRPRAG